MTPCTIDRTPGASCDPAGTRLTDCCEGTALSVPQAINNTPGLLSLSYRVGTQATFFESLLARLATFGVNQGPALPDPLTPAAILKRRIRRTTGSGLAEYEASTWLGKAPLLRDLLTTREKFDPAIALFDAWSTVADVITFYQERIANEGFLRTAQEPRSLHELSRLVGYRPRPGVSSSVYLAFEVDDGTPQSTEGFGNNVTKTNGPVLIPKLTAAKSTPKPGSDEKPQTFETSRELVAYKEWNALVPRKGEPHNLQPQALADLDKLYFAGVGLRLRLNDLVAIDPDPAGSLELRHILAITENSKENRTEVTITPEVLSPKGVKLKARLALETFSNDLATLYQLQLTDELRKELRQMARCAVEGFKTQSLVEVDESLGALLAGPLSDPSGPLWVRLSKLKELAQLLVNTINPALRPPFGVFDPRQFLGDYQQDHTALVNRYTDHLETMDELVRDLASVPALCEKLAVIKSRICDPRILQIDANAAGRPTIFVAFDESGAVTPLPMPPATNPDTVDLKATLQFDSAASGTSVQAILTSVVALGWTTDPTNPVLDVTETLAQLQTRLSTYTFEMQDTRLCILHLELLESGTHVTSALRLIRRSRTLGDFEGIEIERTCYCPRGFTIPIDIDSRFTIPKAAIYPPLPAQPYWAKIELLGDATLAISLKTGTTYQLNPQGGSKWLLTPSGSPLPRTLTELQDALRALQILNVSSFFQAAILISLFDVDPSTPMPKPVAAVLRDLVFYDVPQPFMDPQHPPAVPSLHGRLAEIHGLLCADTDSPSTATPAKLTAFTTDLNQPAFAGVITILESSRDATAATAKLSEALLASNVPRSSLDVATGDAVSDHNKDFIVDLDVLDGLVKANLQALLSPLSVLDSGQARLDNAIATHETAVAIDSKYLSAWRTSTLPTKVADALAEVSAQPPLKAIKRAEQLHADLVQQVLGLQSPFEGLLGAAVLISQLQTELKEIRSGFAERLKAEVKAYSAGVTLSAPVKALVDPSPPVATPGTLKEQSCSFLNPPSPNCDPNQSALVKLKELLPTVTGAERLAVQAIANAWQKLVQTVTANRKGASGSSTSFGDIGDAVSNSLSQIGSDPSQASIAFVTLAQLLSGHPDLIPQIVGHLMPEQRELLYDALRQTRGGMDQPEPKVWVFRSEARLFGWNAPETPLRAVDPALIVSTVDSVVSPNLPDQAKVDLLKDYIKDTIQKSLDGTTENAEDGYRVFLDGIYKQTIPKTPLVIAKLSEKEDAFRIDKVVGHPRSAYNLSTDCTVVTLNNTRSWWTPSGVPGDFDVIRNTRVFCDAEALPLADVPEPPQIDDDGKSPTSIVLNDLVFGLATGAPLIVEGLPFVNDSVGTTLTRELVTLIDVDQVIENDLYGDRFRTQLTFDRPLRHIYARESLKIYANVVDATHGESVREVLGSGDAVKAFPRFALKRPELTRLPAPTPRGIENVLEVRVNDVAWKEAEAFTELSARAQNFISFTDDLQQTAVVFGDGKSGARLSTGTENIRAAYRAGLGIKGNVDAGQIDQAIGAPLGVKKVINPLPAQGGADPESEDTLRRHVPLAVTAMDRLVSVRDFADFASSYAGIGKASATRLQGVVHVTVASPDSQAFDMQGPIIRNLRRALRLFGDPSQQFALHDREAALLIISARVNIDRDYQWEKVEPRIRQALLDKFNYHNAKLGEDVLLSDAICTIQSIEGVAYVDVDKFDSVRQDQILQLGTRLQNLQLRPRIHVELARFATPQQEFAQSDLRTIAASLSGNPSSNSGAAVGDCGQTDSPAPDPSIPKFRPAQVCFLSPQIRDTLVLERVK